LACAPFVHHLFILYTINHPEYSAHELDRLASEEADDYIANWADRMIDRAKDEQMMDEGGASQARKPKDKQ